MSGSLANQTQFMSNGVNTLVQGSLVLHLIPPLEIEILPQITYTRGEPRFAWNTTATSGTGQLFGDLTAKSAGGTLRASYAFTPALTLQSYAQLFLASGHYDDLKQVTPANGRVTLSQIAGVMPLTMPATALSSAADFEDAALNVNVVLRWEYHLGATLFLVYSRSQIPSVNLGITDVAQLHPSAVLRGSAVDVFLVKLSYWWAS